MVVLFTLKNYPENSQKNPIKLKAHKGPVQGTAEVLNTKFPVFSVFFFQELDI